MKTVNKNKKVDTRDIAFVGMAIAVIEVCKIALQAVPNVETTTFWIMMFTLVLGRKMLFVIPAFILIEGCIYALVCGGLCIFTLGRCWHL